MRHQAAAQGHSLVVLDIPLLFESGAQSEVDATVVVSAPRDAQRQRVLARPGMTEAKFESILARQLPDADKRARADFVIDTGCTLEETRDQVQQLLSRLASRERNAFRSIEARAAK